MTKRTNLPATSPETAGPAASEARPEPGEANPRPRLVVQATGAEFPLAEEVTTIGSGPDNDVVLDDPAVASHQATIHRREDGYLVEDVGSAGGTFVNEQRVEGTLPLQEGDALRAGSTVLTFRIAAEAAVGPEPEWTVEAPAAPPVRKPPSQASQPWLIGLGVAAIAGIVLLCLAAVILAFSGGDRDAAQATQPPVVVATSTRVPVAATDVPQPSATPTPLPTDVTPPPQVEYFQANPPSINAGRCTTLQWGMVTGADTVYIQPEIGGVGTPDSVEVCPGETTEYILTAEGPGGTTAVSAVVDVVAGLPDLTIEAIDFNPNPATEGQEAMVSIAIRNAGAAPAGGFDWQWQAGRDASFEGRIDGLAADEATVVSVAWTPGAPYDSLTTEAQVDTADEIDEQDKRNNRLKVEVRVIPAPSQPQMAELKSEGSLDGFRTNDGRGSTRDEILVGNGEIVQPGGEVVARGFMSFDLSDIPAGATIDRAELRFYQAEVTGDPYGKLGGLVLEHVSYGSSLGNAAFDTPPTASAVVGDPLPAGQWYVLAGEALLPWLQQDVDTGQSSFQLRLRFSTETDGDGEEDWIAIQPGGSILGSSKAPLLVVTYIP